MLSDRIEKVIAQTREAMIRIFLILFAVITFSPALAQHINVNFKIVDNKNEGIPYASVTVLKRGDSGHPQSKVADSSGLVSFPLVKEQYIIKITSANYQSLEKGITVNSAQHCLSFLLDPFVSS